MRCFTACFRTNRNHKKIITNPCRSSKKINTISPQALQNLLETHKNGEAYVAIDAPNEEARHKIAEPINLIDEPKDISSRKHLLETHKNGEASLAIDATEEEAQHEVSNPINLIEESKDKEEEQLNRSGSRKKVTFDLNQVSANSSEIPSNLQKQNGKEEDEENELSNSSVSSYISYPPNHRYHFSRNSDEEFEDIDLEDEVNNIVNGTIQEESSYESLFSLSIDSRKAKPAPELGDKEEVNSPFKQSIKFSAKDPISQSSVLNPIRNTSQLKAAPIRMAASPLKKNDQQEKENIDLNLLDKEPSLKLQECKIAVDASLSSWLVEFSQHDTPNSKSSAGSVGNSPSSERTMKFDNRPILGEVKDEKPIIIGTVGSYLRHTGQATTVYPDSGISSF